MTWMLRKTGNLVGGTAPCDPFVGQPGMETLK